MCKSESVGFSCGMFPKESAIHPGFGLKAKHSPNETPAALPNVLPIATETAHMTQESKREDLDHKPENAGKVGEDNKQLNQQGEQPRPGTPADPKQRPEDA